MTFSDDEHRRDRDRGGQGERGRGRRGMPATALAVILSIGSTSCTFAVKHPAATAAIVGGTVGIATCEVGTDFDEHAACGLVAGSAAALLGGVVLLATLLGGEGDTVLRGEPTGEPGRELPTIEDPDATSTPEPGPAVTPAAPSEQAPASPPAAPSEQAPASPPAAPSEQAPAPPPPSPESSPPPPPAS